MYNPKLAYVMFFVAAIAVIPAIQGQQIQDYRDRITKDVCPNSINTNCTAAATKCLDAFSPDNKAGQNYNQTKSAFDHCVKSQGLTNLLDTYIQANPLKPKDPKGDAKVKQNFDIQRFIDSLKGNDTAAAKNLNCCMIAALEPLIKNNARTNAPTEIVSIQSLLRTYSASIDACAVPADCDIYELKRCALRTCINAVSP